MSKHLTASAWSHCDRAMWLRFRDAFDIDVKPERQLVMLMGSAIEQIVIDELKSRGHIIGYQQAELTGNWGQPIARIDGITKTPDGEIKILEVKAVSSKVFKAILKNGLPDYYEVQDQIAMHHSAGVTKSGDQLKVTHQAVINRDTGEMLEFDVSYLADHADLQSYRLHEIATREDMPESLIDDPDVGWRCNMCEFNAFCRDGLIPRISCRTCANVSIVDGEFECAHGSEECDNHIFHPAFMLSLGHELQSADAENMAITYGLFCNARVGYKHHSKETFTSREYADYFKQQESKEDENAV